MGGGRHREWAGGWRRARVSSRGRITAGVLLLQTSNTISWSLYQLAQNPDIQERLYREVAAVCPGNELPDSDHIAQMPYLKAVVRETLR